MIAIFPSEENNDMPMADVIEHRQRLERHYDLASRDMAHQLVRIATTERPSMHQRRLTELARHLVEMGEELAWWDREERLMYAEQTETTDNPNL